MDVSLRIRSRVLTLSVWSLFVFRHGIYAEKKNDGDAQYLGDDGDAPYLGEGVEDVECRAL